MSKSMPGRSSCLNYILFTLSKDMPNPPPPLHKRDTKSKKSNEKNWSMKPACHLKTVSRLVGSKLTGCMVCRGIEKTYKHLIQAQNPQKPYEKIGP